MPHASRVFCRVLGLDTKDANKWAIGSFICYSIGYRFSLGVSEYDRETMSQDSGRTEWNREQLRADDASHFEGRFARLARTEVHWLIPAEWFAPASSECRDMFRDGHFYGCICVAQAVGETLATKFLMDHHPAAENEPGNIREKLFRAGVITHECRLAFLLIRGDDRNDFHHLNTNVPTERVKLEQRAEE